MWPSILLAFLIVVTIMLHSRWLNLRGARRAPRPAVQPTSSGKEAVGGDEAVPEPRDGGPFEPSVPDVLVAKAMLLRGLRLPAELVNTILDYAEYWPHSTVAIGEEQLSELGKSPIQGATGSGEDRFIIRTAPLGFINPPTDNPENYMYSRLNPVPRLREKIPVERLQGAIGAPEPTPEFPCRKIVFTITSSDQGWGGDPRHRGSFLGSFTWFDAEIESFDATHECNENCTSSAEDDQSSAQSEDAGEADEGEDFTFVSGGEEHSAGPTTEESSLASGGSKGEGESYRAAAAAASADSLSPRLSLCALRPTYPDYEIPNTGPPGLLRRPFRLIGTENKIQCNRTATGTMETHRVEWRADDDVTDPQSPRGDELQAKGRGRRTGDGRFVRSLRLGDAVTVWASARFPGWRNNIRSVQVDVYWML